MLLCLLGEFRNPPDYSSQFKDSLKAKLYGRCFSELHKKPPKKLWWGLLRSYFLITCLQWGVQIQVSKSLWLYRKGNYTKDATLLDFSEHLFSRLPLKSCFYIFYWSFHLRASRLCFLFIKKVKVFLKISVSNKKEHWLSIYLLLLGQGYSLMLP